MKKGRQDRIAETLTRLVSKIVSRLETIRFTPRNKVFLGVKHLVSNRVETNYEIALLILLNGGI